MILLEVVYLGGQLSVCYVPRAALGTTLQGDGAGSVGTSVGGICVLPEALPSLSCAQEGWGWGSCDLRALGSQTKDKIEESGGVAFSWMSPSSER